jgi:hypothetical protein
LSHIDNNRDKILRLGWDITAIDGGRGGRRRRLI